MNATRKAEDNQYAYRKLVHHLDILGGCGLCGLRPVLAVKNCPTILVKLDGGDHNFAGVDTDGRSSTVGFVALHTVNMNDPFLAVHLRNLSFPTLVFPPQNPYFVIFADW